MKMPRLVRKLSAHLARMRGVVRPIGTTLVGCTGASSRTWDSGWRFAGELDVPERVPGDRGHELLTGATLDHAERHAFACGEPRYTHLTRLSPPPPPPPAS